MSEQTEKFRVTNVTNLIPGQAGFFLNFHGVFLHPGKPATVDIDRIQKMKKNENVSVDPSLLHEWAAKGWIRLKDSTTGETISSDMGQDVDAPTAHLNEAMASRVKNNPHVDDDMSEFEDEFDPTDAKEAVLPNQAAFGGHAPSTRQIAGARANISTTGEEGPDPIGEGPIPGARAVNVDNSDQFTVKAPRSNHAGGVIKS